MFICERDLFFTLIMIFVTAGLFRLWRFKPVPMGFLGIWLAQGFIGLTVGVRFSRDFFEIMRFATQIVFIHWTFLAIALSWCERHSSPRIAWVAVVNALVLSGIAFDAFAIEPFQLDVRRTRIESPKLEKPLKLVFISDPQIEEVGEPEMRPWLQAMAENPDLIIVGGDITQEFTEARRHAVRVRLNEFLRQIGFSAPLGIYVVEGNLDYGVRWGESFASLPARLFDVSGHVDLPGLRITGLCLEQSIVSGMRVPGTDRFHIVVGHVPNFANGKIDADLLLAGHCHGGQVRIPGIGPLLVNADITREQCDGWTVFPDGRRLLVSRGAGLERGHSPRLRFCCPPEIHVIDLVPAPRPEPSPPAMAD